MVVNLKFYYRIRKLKKIILRVVAILLLLLVLIVIILSMPSVQTSIAKKVTKKINEDYGTNIQIDRIGLNWKGEVDIRDLYIEDHHKDTLIFTEVLQTSILSAKRLIDGDLDFAYAELHNTKFYLKTYHGEVDDNLTVFTDKFETGKPTSSKPFEMLIDEVSLNNTRVKIIDENVENPEIFDFSDRKIAF